MRNHYGNAREIIMATAVLHNIAIYWEDQDDLPDDEGGLFYNAAVYNEAEDLRVNPAQRLQDRREGDVVRDNMRLTMPPRTQREIAMRI